MKDAAARTEQIKEVFATAMSLDAAARPAALDEACGGDEELRQAVMTLLENYDSAQQFFAQFPENFAREALGLTAGPPAFAAGDLVAGRFRIVGFLGAGGMGEVYEAEDLLLPGEHVALKTLPADISGDPRAIDRLKRELALARHVTHVNVCRVFDVDQHVAATGAVIAFFTMERLIGETLAARLERCGRLPAADALPLVRQMVAALGAAHAAGVIHGDFKPGNIVLVPSATGERLVVTDFGLARRDAASRSASTSGAAWGTPVYMAPEQLAGHPPTRASDVYALSAVVFETVTGKQPFEMGPDDDGALDPAWRAALRRGLDARPDARTGSVEAFLASLTPGAPASRLGRPLVVALACLAVLLAAVLLFSPLRSRWWTETDDGAAVASGTSRSVAVLAFTPSDETPAADAFARGLSAAIADDLGRAAGRSGLRFVPPAALPGTGVDGPARAHRVLGADLIVTGRVDGATGQRRVAVELHQGSAGQAASTPHREIEIKDGTRALSLVRQEVAQVLAMRLAPALVAALDSGSRPAAIEERYVLGRGYLEQGRAARGDAARLDLAIEAFQRAIDGDPAYAEAHAALAEGLVLKYAATKDTARNTALLDLAERSAAEACRLAPAVARFHVIRASTYLATGRHPLAIPALEEAVRIDPDAPGARNNLASAYEATGQLPRAEQTLEQAVASQPRSWSAHEDLGVFRWNHGQYKEAEAHFLKGREYAPDNPRVIANLAGLYTLTEQFDAAEQELKRGLALAADPVLYNNLGWAYFYQGNFADGVESLKQAIALTKDDSVVLASLARGYRWMARPRDASRAYAAAIAAARRQISADPRNPEVLANLAYLYAETGERGEALRLIERARADAPANVRVTFMAALALELSGQRQAALDALRAAIAGGHPKYQIAHHPDLRALRADPRYLQLIATVTWKR